ncbi:response regulator [Streptomyces sp. KL118A]|uniref:response regulator n=1 Tax=Streptomyces sp. KL118A TaxID=3045153 RepID=UPI003531815E
MSDQPQPDGSDELKTAISDALRQAESAAAVDRADLDRRREALLGWLTEHMDTDPDAPAEVEAATPDDGAAREPEVVLVVDDNKVMRQLIRVNLELEGYAVVTAADGLECLQLVHEVRPDLVILDVVMPRLDGLGAAARLRADPLTRDIPLVAVGVAPYEAGIAAGVDALLAKPFDPAELLGLVRTLLERSGSRGDGTEHPAEGGPMVGKVFRR